MKANIYRRYLEQVGSLQVQLGLNTYKNPDADVLVQSYDWNK